MENNITKPVSPPSIFKNEYYPEDQCYSPSLPLLTFEPLELENWI